MFDLHIRNGMIADGSGEEMYRASVYVKDGRIAKITEDETLEALETADAEGLTVSPGFMDIHTHSDSCPWKCPGFEGRLHQGVTTDISGNCGESLVPKKEQKNPSVRSLRMKDMAEELSHMKYAANFGMFTGHGNLRLCCMEDPYKEIPSDEELCAMKKLLSEEIDAGSMGLSLGLEYMPGMCCRTAELTELAKVVAEKNAVVSVHMRNEDARVLDAMEECHQISKESGAHVHISHLKVCSLPQWGKAGEVLKKFDEIRSDSFITADQYPYTAFGTGMKSLLPKWAKQGTNEEITEKIRNDETWQKALPEVMDHLMRDGGPEKLVPDNTYGQFTEIEGKSLQEIADWMGTDVYDAYRKIMLKCGSRAHGIYHAMNPDDVLMILKRQDISLISDSGSQDFVTGVQEGNPHPRSTQSAVKFLRLNREYGLMPLEKAVRKLTALPAETFGIKDRGMIKEGYYADIVIFDPEEVKDNGTFGDPFRVADGIKKVYVNGKPAFCDKKPTGIFSGMFVGKNNV